MFKKVFLTSAVFGLLSSFLSPASAMLPAPTIEEISGASPQWVLHRNPRLVMDLWSAVVDIRGQKWGLQASTPQEQKLDAPILTGLERTQLLRRMQGSNLSMHEGFVLTGGTYPQVEYADATGQYHLVAITQMESSNFKIDEQNRCFVEGNAPPAQAQGSEAETY